MARIIAAFTQFLDGAGNPLVDGKIRFTQSGTNNTDKTTFSNSDLTDANTNPVILDGNGLCPNVFGTGVYRAALLTKDDVATGRIFDPVGGAGADTQGGDYVAGDTYNISDITRASDNNYYRSITNNNIGNEPSANENEWELLQYGRFWNANITYTATSSVYGSDGVLYFSKAGGNLNNNPVSTSSWVSSAIADLAQLHATSLYF